MNFRKMQPAERPGEKTGALKLEIGLEGRRSVIRDSLWTAPLKVAKPFYLDNSGEVFIYLMNQSGGMVRGDSYRIEVTLDKGAMAFLTGQSATKIYKTPGGCVNQRCIFTVGEGGVLEYFPDPVIPFAGSNFRGETEVRLSGGATVFLGEILAPGRLSRGEAFQFSRYYSRTRVYAEGGVPILWDVLDLEPGRRDYSLPGLYEGYTHLAHLFIFSDEAGRDLSDELHHFIASFPGLLGSASLTRRTGVAARILGRGCGELEMVIRGCWNIARQRLTGRPAPAVRK
ncbi:MAG: urease accessory protein UreD [Bacillota bacterium]